MFIESDEINELFKGILPVYLLYIVPLILIMSPVGVTASSHEFPVYRMTQYDLHGIPRGCRSSMINLEARSIKNWSSGRHCVVARLDHITAATLVKIKETAGALLIVLPRSPQHLSAEEVKELTKVLSILSSDDVSLPIYLIGWSIEIEKILNEIMGSATLSGAEDHHISSARTSSVDLLTAVFSKNGYQVVVSAARPSPRHDAAVSSIQGKLSGYGVEDKLPTIVIVAHYDAQSIAPELAFGAESNASGVVMLLELCRLLSLLYSNSRTHGHVNIVFLLSGGGSLNYQGSKKWLEDQLESVDSTLLQDVQFVLCLDSVAQPNLHMHVSKPPRERTPLYNFYSELQNASGDNLEIIHKKINLADDILAWEHERYSIRRLPATTISSLKNHRELRKDGLFDGPERVDIKSLSKNIENIASALARHIYNISRDPATFSQQHLGVYEDQVKMWMEFLASHPRSPSVMYEKANPMLRVLHETLKRYLEDAKVVHHTADKRDPEFVFYDTSKANINIYNVKPAIFDLFLTIQISVYLTLVFLVVQNFHLLYGALVPSGVRKLKSL